MTNTEFTYEITEHIATLSTRGAWSMELNKVSWGGRPAVYDLRKWSPDHSKMSKGVSLTDSEFEALMALGTPSAE